MSAHYARIAKLREHLASTGFRSTGAPPIPVPRSRRMRPTTAPSKPEPKEVWGPRKWAWLHRRPLLMVSVAAELVLLEEFRAGLSCGECRNGFTKILKENPPRFTTPVEYAAYTNYLHNLVNAKLNKPIMSWDEAVTRWGWSRLMRY